MIVHATPGDAIVLSLSVTDENDPTLNPITGQSPTCAIRKISDDTWYDFTAAAWDVAANYAALGAEHKKALTDKGDGTYEADWDQAIADASAAETYSMVYEVPSGNYEGMDYDLWIFDTASSSLGSGSKSVSVLVNDQNGNPVPNIKVTVKNSAQTADIGYQTTNALGTTPSAFGLDASTAYKIILSGGAITNTYSNPYSVTTAAGVGAETLTVTCTVSAAPVAANASNYLLFDYERKVEADAVYGASAMTVKIIGVSVTGQTDATANAQRAILGTSYVTDANGYWAVEVAQSLNGSYITIQKQWTGADTLTKTEKWSAKIDDAKADASDRMCFADLSPKKIL